MLDHTRTRTYRFRCVHCGATKLTTQVSSSLLRLEMNSTSSNRRTTTSIVHMRVV